VLDVTLDPETGRLTGTDRLAVDWRPRLRLGFHPALEAELRCGGRVLAQEPAPAPAPAGNLRWTSVRLPRNCRDEDGRAQITAAFSGVVADPVEKEPSLHFVTGDRTSGLISKDGAFLSGGGWHPDTGNLALFDLTARVPEGWSVVSQGRREGAEPGSFRYVSDIPGDGLSLSAGPYVVVTRQHGDVTLGAWLLPGDEGFAEPLLDAAAKEIDRLSQLAGPYRFPKFDVVENFFTTGYGFPSYTLLGQDVIRMGARALRPGYVDHEIAHVWFGNDVLVDPASGNWCEGLVSYLTNYLNSATSEEEALAYRRRVSQRYSVDVDPSKDVAPAAWREKEDDAGASIGYGKVSMVFHALARRLGDDAFRAGLRDFTSAHGGARASWASLEESFERASGTDLGPFFAQWIGRAGLPRLALAKVRADDDGLIRGDVVQEGEPYDLDLELELERPDGTRVARAIQISGATSSFAVASDGPVAIVRLDPAWHVPRRLEAGELPATLARTMAAKPLVIQPDEPEADDRTPMARRRRALRELARLPQEQGATVMAVKDVAEADLTGHSLLVLGAPEDNPYAMRYAEAILDATGTDVTQLDSFRAGDRRWSAPTQALLASAPHPERPGATVTVLEPLSSEALASERAPFFYGWDGWAVLDGGRATTRGTRWPEPATTTVALRTTSARPRDRMMSLIRRLVAPEMEGREAGSAADVPRVLMLSRALEEAGVAPALATGYQHAFSFPLVDLPQSAALKTGTTEDARAFVPVVPAHDTVPLPDTIVALEGITGIGPRRVTAPWRVAFPRGVVFVGDAPRLRFEGLDLAESLAVVRDTSAQEPPPEEQARRIDAWMEQARLRNAAGLVVLRPAAARPEYSALTVFASGADAPWKERARAAGGERGVAGAAPRRRAFSPRVKWQDRPVLFAGKDLADALEAQGALHPGGRAWAGGVVDVRYNVASERLEDANVLGRVTGSPGGGPEILVSAHHDSVGVGPDGRFTQGAVDNASGVAVVLEVARRIAALPPARDVVFALTGAEEWGLQGSRRLAADWPEPLPAAVVNVDSVGMREPKLHVVGRSREPALAAVIFDAATHVGFAEGPDIDEHADTFGSDHWPWAERGVMAVDVFQADYRKINGPDDTIELIDPDALERLADALEEVVRRLAI
jgi:hypothetical protein